MKKLSKTQQAVIDLMQEGWILRSFEGAWLSLYVNHQVQKINVGAATIRVLRKQGLIHLNKKTSEWPINRWTLT